jgi:hypothetical protein
MNKMTDIQRKVDEAMDSVLGINRATPNPFLYTRIIARISREENSYWEKMTRMISRPAIAVITMSAILMINLFVVINETSASSVKPNIAEVATADDLGTNSFYDIENVQP